MILPAHKREIPFPAAGVATIAVVVAAGKGIRQTVTLSRLRETSFDAIRRHAPGERGVPIYWTARFDGHGEMWPVPDRDYEAQVRDTHGREIGGGRSAPPPPVTELVSAFAAAEQEHRRAVAAVPERVERFGGFGKEEG